MSNISHYPGPKKAHIVLLSTLLTVMAGVFVLAMVLLNAKDAARQDRALAWQKLIEAAPTVEEREVMAYYASRVRGCFANSSANGDLPKLQASLIPSQNRDYYREHLIAHEHICLDNLRGEVRALTQEFQDSVFELSVPL